jgi:dihydroflavonol-4-reductase
MSVQEGARVLKERMGDEARQVPTRMLPDWFLRIMALVSPQVKEFAPDLGKVRRATNEKARRLLGWNPRSNEEAIVATARSLIQLGLVGESSKAA